MSMLSLKIDSWKKTWLILGLQPRDKAAMLVVNTIFFSKNLHEK